MNKPDNANSHLLDNTVLQLRVNDQQAELVRMRCEMLLHSNFSSVQQRQLRQDNQLLLLSLVQAWAVNISTQAQLRQLTLSSQCDMLTQTLNRSMMLDRLQQAISLAKRQQGSFAVLFIDLNKFKPINDRFGHAAGDMVLQQVSARLQLATRDSDAVGRHGGDEFIILLNNITRQQDASVFAAKLTALLEQPYQLAHDKVLLSASIGIACYPIDADNVQALIGHADAAMYRSKQQGCGYA